MNNPYVTGSRCRCARLGAAVPRAFGVRARRALYGASLGTALFATNAIADPPIATISYTIDANISQVLSLVGTQQPNGNFMFNGSVQPPNGQWLITYYLSVDAANNDTTGIAGTIAIKNNSDTTHSYKVTFDVPICPAIENGSLMGGTAKVTLTASGPGLLTCGEGTGLVQASADDVPVTALFACPFQLGSTGSGTLSSTAQFGLPGPTFVGPTSLSSIGETLSLQLTSGDTAAFQTTLTYKDADGAAPPACPGDLDLNGWVNGGDIGALFTVWGTSSNCPASLDGDLNGDGTVDADDLLILLSQWGECGGDGPPGHGHH